MRHRLRASALGRYSGEEADQEPWSFARVGEAARGRPLSSRLPLLSNLLFEAAVMTRRRALAAVGSLALLAGAGACGDGDGDVQPKGPIRLVFKHHPLGDAAA